MKQNEKLKLFISYSHKDNLKANPYIEQFKTHISLLKDNGLIQEWYDREILPNEDFQDEIDSNLNKADIICLFISANFLSSKSCKDEKRKALELRKKKGIPVISIILSQCAWLDDKDLSKLVALPTDGKAVSDFGEVNAAWNDVYYGLKRIIENELNIRQLEITDDFHKFLQNTEMLTKAHSQKENVFLDDIFICTELDKFDDLMEYKETIISDDLVSNLFDCKKICIAGENQSGKTTLCKRIFIELRNYNFVPVYVSDQNTNFVGKMDNYIFNLLQEQYQNIDIEEIDEKRIIPIIDDFHKTNKKEKHIKDLSRYSYCIIIVDDIFGLNIEDDTLSSSFTTFMIKELKPSFRYRLIKKWIGLTDKSVENNSYKDIDKNTMLIDTTLGKNIGKGIMPAYPFHILSTIITYETFSMSLDQEITSQGYCYQAFIYYYLRRHGVKNDEIDIYINFLTELAFHIYDIKKEDLNPSEFTEFMKSYSETYNLPIEQQELLTNLREIASEDSFRNFSFRYPYFYYFFIAKYISEHMDDSKVMEKIDNIINNLHVDENAYIAVFLMHHSKNGTVFSKIESIALSLFGKYEPATLTKDEMKFFDAEVHTIIEQALPTANVTPEKERAERLNHQDEMEKINGNRALEEQIEKKDPLEIELRRAIKTVEVMGCIIRNRAGSLKKVELENLFLNGMNVHLRILTSLFELIRSESNQEKIVDIIVEKLNNLEEEMGPHKKLHEEQKREFAKTLFWNINFLMVCSIIHKIIHSLGSDKLTVIVDSVCDKVNTPASFLIKHGISMNYNKNLQIDELSEGLRDDGFSKVSTRVIKFMVADYCSIHSINYRERQRIQSKIGITTKIIADNTIDDE